MDQETKDILLMLVDGFKDMRADIKDMKAGVHEVQASSQDLRHQQEVMHAKLDHLTLTTVSVESVKKLRTDVCEHLQQMGREIAAG